LIEPLGRFFPADMGSVMGRSSEHQQIEKENELIALGYFDQALRDLIDPRRRQGLRYPLRTVVATALMAMVCGCDDAESMEYWGEANAEWLSTFLELPHGAPTQDVFLHVLGALDPKAFQQVYQRWASLVSLRLGQDAPHIAIDGKTSRRSADRGSGKAAIHTVSAFLSGAGLVLAQTQVRDKSNEITAIPELLRVLDLRGATVTIDAMGCQTHIAESIIEGGGQYVLSVKENQPSLYREIVETFSEADDARMRAVDETPRPELLEYEETEKGHGRLETRRVRIADDLEWILSCEKWRNLGFVVEVRRERTVIATGKSSSETAYYIGSGAPESASFVARAIRRHWAIENELHWVLDIAFREDEARHRAKNTASNLATLRHFALGLVKQDPTRKLGVANSRKRAGFDRNYLVQLIQGDTDS
jgi:predicted transposase YbfD/YdcC